MIEEVLVSIAGQVCLFFEHALTILGHSCSGGTNAPSICAAGSYASGSASLCSSCNGASSDYCPVSGMSAPYTCPSGFTVSNG